MGSAKQKNYFSISLSEDQLQTISSIALAHMGDAVFEILVRGWLCVQGKATGKGLHQATIRMVCAESQAEKAERILPLLTEEELAAFKRGRNAHVKSVPGHASRAQYGEAPRWKHCWAGCISAVGGTGSTNSSMR